MFLQYTKSPIILIKQIYFFIALNLFAVEEQLKRWTYEQVNQM